jgi:hypothetical protein
VQHRQVSTRCDFEDYAAPVTAIALGCAIEVGVFSLDERACWKSPMSPIKVIKNSELSGSRNLENDSITQAPAVKSRTVQISVSALRHRVLRLAPMRTAVELV